MLEIGIDVLLPESLAYRLQNIDSGAKFRWKIWIDSWHMFTDNPIFGIGPGNYKQYLVWEKPYLKIDEYIPDQPENGYLKILYESGLVGVSCFFLFLFLIGRKAWRCLQGPEPYRSYALAAICQLLVFAMSFATLFTVSDKRNFMIIVMVVVILVFAEKGALRIRQT